MGTGLTAAAAYSVVTTEQNKTWRDHLADAAKPPQDAFGVAATALGAYLGSVATGSGVAAQYRLATVLIGGAVGNYLYQALIYDVMEIPGFGSVAKAAKDVDSAIHQYHGVGGVLAQGGRDLGTGIGNLAAGRAFNTNFGT